MEKRIAVATKKCPTCQMRAGQLCRKVLPRSGRKVALPISRTHVLRTI